MRSTDASIGVAASKVTARFKRSSRFSMHESIKGSLEQFKKK